MTLKSKGVTLHRVFRSQIMRLESARHLDWIVSSASRLEKKTILDLKYDNLSFN